jgi:hypothetical protein
MDSFRTITVNKYNYLQLRMQLMSATTANTTADSLPHKIVSFVYIIKINLVLLLPHVQLTMAS